MTRSISKIGPACWWASLAVGQGGFKSVRPRKWRIENKCTGVNPNIWVTFLLGSLLLPLILSFFLSLLLHPCHVLLDVVAYTSWGVVVHMVNARVRSREWEKGQLWWALCHNTKDYIQECNKQGNTIDRNAVSSGDVLWVGARYVAFVLNWLTFDHLELARIWSWEHHNGLSEDGTQVNGSAGWH